MTPSNDKQPLVVSLWRNTLANPLTPRVGIAVACFLLIFFITANHLAHPKSPRLNVGDVARKDYLANESVTYIDSEATSDARDTAAAEVLPVYSIDIIKNNGILSNIKTFFDRLEELSDELEQRRAIASMPPVETVVPDEGTASGEEDEPAVPRPHFPEINIEEFENTAIAELARILDDSVNIPRYLIDPVSEEDLSALMKLDSDTRNTIRTIVDEAMKIRTADRIDEDEIPDELDILRKAILDDASENLLTPEIGRISSQVASYFLRSNSALDLTATSTAQAAARENTEPALKQVSRGQIFLRQGEVVDQEHLDILGTLGLTTGDTGASPWFSILFFGVMLLLAFIMGAGFLTGRTLPMLKDPRYYLLFYTIVVIAYLGSFFLIQSFPDDSGGSKGYIQIIITSLPVIAAAVLLAHYFTRIISITIAGFLAVIVSLAAGNSAIIIPALFTSIAAGIYVRRDCPKNHMIRAIFILPAVWVCALLAEIYISGADLADFWAHRWYLLLGITPALVAIVLANYVLDGAFNIPTSSRLAEFDNQDHPLLKKLQLEAPGTWHHSMMVGLIAEAACQAIGGNAHLTRVACMYHDIGKSRRPEFFIENQTGGVNLHEKYSPWLSKIIVESHVKDGIAMARSHGLPQELVDMIPQHHGTTLIAYFFRKALAMSEDGFVNEYDYRYPGPKPQTPEAACINLADAAESAARSLEEPTPHRIESLVNKIYEDRLLDGQYDECSLALNQLETIKDLIIDRLIGAYHARIDYPEEEEMRRQYQLKRAEGDKPASNGAVVNDEE